MSEAKFCEEKLDKTTEIYNRKLNLDSIAHSNLYTGGRYYCTKSRIHRNGSILLNNFAEPTTGWWSATITLSFQSTQMIIGYCFGRIDNLSVDSESNQISDSELNPRGGYSKQSPIQYVCARSTYQSNDAEYRGGFMVYEHFMKAVKHPQIEHIEEMWVELLSADVGYTLHVQCMANEQGHAASQHDTQPRHDSQQVYHARIEELVNSSRVAIYMLCSAWLFTYGYMIEDIIENHANPAIYDLFPIDGPINEIMKEVYEKTETVNVIVAGLSSHADCKLSGENAPLRCGQKLFPLQKEDLRLYADIKRSVWRELYLQKKCSNLVLNQITPCFPLPATQFIVPTAFDNPKIQSDPHMPSLNVIGEWVGRTLRDVANSVVGETVPGDKNLIFKDIEIFDKHLFEFVYSFAAMNIHLGIMHGDLHMNNVTLHRVSQLYKDNRLKIPAPHVLYKTRLSSKLSSKWRDDDNKKTQQERVNETSASDTSAGSATGSTDKTQQHDEYLFRHNGIYPMIIDMSRAIIDDREEYRREYPYMDALLSEEAERISRAISLRTDIPYAEVKKRFVKDFNLAFKTFSIVDSLSLLVNMRDMFLTDDVFDIGDALKAPKKNLNKNIQRGGNRVKIHKDIIGRLDHLIISARRILELGMESPGEWPNLELLHEWDHYLANRVIRGDDTRPPLRSTTLDPIAEKYRIFLSKNLKKELNTYCNIIDIFRMDSTLEWDVMNYDAWGPLLRQEWVFEMWEKAMNEVADPPVSALKKYTSDYDPREEVETLYESIDDTSTGKSTSENRSMHNTSTSEPKAAVKGGRSLFSINPVMQFSGEESLDSSNLTNNSMDIEFESWMLE